MPNELSANALTCDPTKDESIQSACTRRTALRALAAWGAAPMLGKMTLAAGQAGGAQMVGGSGGSNLPRGNVPGSVVEQSSGYRLAFTGPVAELVGDLESTERGDPTREAEVPHGEWYSAGTRRRFGIWGPGPREYLPLQNLNTAPVEWLRERMVATAARFLGYAYQYHHVPDWNPPPSWPWRETCAGRNSKGVDCSNLTSFVLNQGFGVRVSSAIGRQAERTLAFERPHDAVALKVVELPTAYARRVETLRTGDLVYIRGREGGPISHVVIWVGGIGRSPSGVPLVIDSHGANVRDDAGRKIPCGVQLRPFREDSWYNHCASHAHRLFG